MPSKAPSKSKLTAPKKPAAPKPMRTTRDIPAAEKNKRSTMIGEEDGIYLLRKLRSHLPIHNDAHPIAEDMKMKERFKTEIVESC